MMSTNTDKSRSLLRQRNDVDGRREPSAPTMDRSIPVAQIIEEDDAPIHVLDARRVTPQTTGTTEMSRDSLGNEDDVLPDPSSSGNDDDCCECAPCVYPGAYGLRCSCMKCGMDNCDVELNLIVCFSFFLNLDGDCWNCGFEDKYAKSQLCCLGCTIDPSRCCCIHVGKEDCMCSPTKGTPLGLQCCCLHTGFLIKKCTENDCFQLKLCCLKASIDGNFRSHQCCCFRCGQREIQRLPSSLDTSGW